MTANKVRVRFYQIIMADHVMPVTNEITSKVETTRVARVGTVVSSTGDQAVVEDLAGDLRPVSLSHHITVISEEEYFKEVLRYHGTKEFC